MSDGFIYLLIGEESGKIKVGFSKYPERRLKQIAQGLNERVRMIATTPGTRSQEQTLHHRLAPVRVKGEWYASALAVYRILEARMQEFEALERGILDPRGIA